MQTNHEPPGSTADRNNPRFHATPTVKFKHQESMSFGDTDVMIWHLVASFNTPKPKQHSIEEVKRTFMSIERSLDLARTAAGQSDAFLLFNPSAKACHVDPIDPTELFDLSQYSDTVIPFRPVSRFELSFAVLSPHQQYWNEMLPFSNIQSACQSVGGKCFPDAFLGKQNALFGIVTECFPEYLPRDKIEKILESEYLARFGQQTQFKLRKSQMKFKLGSTGRSSEIIQVYGLSKDKQQALGFLSSFFLSHMLRPIGFSRAAFTPMNMLAGPTNATYRAQCLSAHQKFIDEHKVILLRGVSVTNWTEEASSAKCKEVLSEKTFMQDKLKSNSLYDLFFNYLVDSRVEPVALSSYTTPAGSSTVFLVVPIKRMNNAFEAVHQLNTSSYRTFFFTAPFDSALPSECLAYLSKGTDRSSRQEITNREKTRRLNLERDFPSIQNHKKGKPPAKSSKQSSTPNKSYASATAPQPPSFTPRQTPMNDPKIVDLTAENDRLKERIRELEEANADLSEQLEERERNMSSLNNATSSLFKMFSSLVDHLKLPTKHALRRDLRRSEIFADECKAFQRDLHSEFFTPSDEESPNDSTHRSSSSSTLKQSSLSIRRSEDKEAHSVHFAGQKRDLSPTGKLVTLQKRVPLLENGTSNNDMETDSDLQYTGASSSPGASEIQ